ncbi:MAG: hypothetical protein ACR2MZ_03045 [Candidatus Dormibacter sp.]|uniref:hypothetical protein n=1 Tax=Candidatus Dormibacter sp. TaxID=2973982 RepID=UPI000DB2275C|nr:MAG: hypothetical protein DLM66_04210 [Candidatus Dormibacteraeota bacterium]
MRRAWDSPWGRSTGCSTGGYPELHAEALAQNTNTIAAVRELTAGGAPIYAECGGLMYLGEHLCMAGSKVPLWGVLPFSTAISGGLKLSYAEVHTTGGLFGAGRRARAPVPPLGDSRRRRDRPLLPGENVQWRFGR